MIFLIAVAALFAGYGTAYLASDDVRYLTRAGIEETRILQARQPIAELAADPRTDPALRDALGLVVASRDYAARLGLDAKQTYTTYADVGPGHPAPRPAGRPADCICPHTWKYPIVGRIPYKGFFDLACGPARGRPAGRARLRHVPAAVGRLLDAGVVQRPAALHRRHRRLGRARGDGVPRDRAQHAVREERHALQRELRPVRGLPLGRVASSASGATRSSRGGPPTGGTTRSSWATSMRLW